MIRISMSRHFISTYSWAFTSRQRLHHKAFIELECNKNLAFLSLAVIGIGTVFAQEMFIQQRLRHRLNARHQKFRMEGHHCHFFKDNGIVNRIQGSLPQQNGP